MSLPYHDRRSIPGHPRADHLIGPNIGLTMQAGRQAVLDVRRTLRWLEQQGYGPLGLLGTSIGSAVGFITMCHEPAVKAGCVPARLDVFWRCGRHRLDDENRLGADRAQPAFRKTSFGDFWSPISPFPYIARLTEAKKKLLLITARYDPTFRPEYTEALLDKLRAERVPFEGMSLPCGHYSLGVKPFSYIAGHRFGKFLQKALTK